MAQFSSRGAMMLLFNNGEGIQSGGGSVDSIPRKLGSPIHIEGRRPGSFAKWFFLRSECYAMEVGAHAQQKMKEEAVLGGDDKEEHEYGGGGDDELSCFRGLVLDVAYRPVNVVCWRRAISLEFMEKADVLEYYDQTVNSPSGSFYIPAVLRVPQLLQVIKRRRLRNNLSRKNILYRDNYTCQYCSSRENLTIDHVMPISLAGEWTWENLVTACSRCNSKKGQKTIEEANMKLFKVPKAPKDYDILAIPLTNAAARSLHRRKGTPEEWHQYIGRPPLAP
ncbi:hypothetical protein MLD38_004572 [Melastoma candidum]|uniref:Uncharacterized protein n=1 Tax=Melastoma candidum TaxID=119954 RepID=A0ACB9S7F0_9MYRT|nr:hypothetical protein MLD38_004572 [Melastoma candidum]